MREEEQEMKEREEKERERRTVTGHKESAAPVEKMREEEQRRGTEN